jgi:hypothetical protein
MCTLRVNQKGSHQRRLLTRTRAHQRATCLRFAHIVLIVYMFATPSVNRRKPTLKGLPAHAWWRGRTRRNSRGKKAHRQETNSVEHPRRGCEVKMSFVPIFPATCTEQPCLVFTITTRTRATSSSMTRLLHSSPAPLRPLLPNALPLTLYYWW